MVVGSFLFANHHLRIAFLGVSMRFDFSTSNRILFGPGTLKEIGPIAKSMGSHALLVQPQLGLDDTPLPELLAQAGVRTTPFHVSGEPVIGLVQSAIATARAAGCDFVIAMGGGSAIDTGKACGVLLSNPGDLLDYLEVVGKNQPLQYPGLPVIAIPTTAGTGAEVTKNAVLGVPEQKFKVSLRGPYLLPRLALVDPELTHSLPPTITAATGLDALTQAIEPYVSKRANPLVDLWCREGILRAGRSLRRAFNDGSNPAAREDMAYTSLLGGLSLANAGLGAVHGFAAPLGGEYSAPHGAICAALLAAAMKINVRALRERAPAHPALERYAEVARLLTGNPTAETGDGIAWVEETVRQFNIPSLSTYGLTPADLPRLVEKAAKASSMQANPIVLTAAELTKILEMSI
jgi:alcohol dehydrogenase class IV